MFLSALRTRAPLLRRTRDPDPSRWDGVIPTPPLGSGWLVWLRGLPGVESRALWLSPVSQLLALRGQETSLGRPQCEALCVPKSDSMVAGVRVSLACAYQLRFTGLSVSCEPGDRPGHQRPARAVLPLRRGHRSLRPQACGGCFHQPAAQILGVEASRAVPSPPQPCR